MPLHLLLGLRTSETPSEALQRRRTSPGISLKYRHCSLAFQMGPSVNLNPVQSFSTPASLSTSCSSTDDITSTESPIQLRLLNIHVCPSILWDIGMHCQGHGAPEQNLYNDAEKENRKRIKII